MVPPLGVTDKSIHHHNVCVILEVGCGALWEGYLPDTSVAPLHRIFDIAGNEADVLAPFCLVMYCKCYLHCLKLIAKPPPGAILM